jgi:hypothetical protein
MPISVKCMCGRPFQLEEELAGKKIRCPDCMSVLSVPEPGTEPASAPAWKSPDEQTAPASERIPSRKVQPIKLSDDYAASRTKSDYASETASEDEPKARRQRALENSGSWLPVSMNSSIVSGLLMMVGAVVWFVVGLAANRIFFYPPFLFCFGIAAVFKGFRGQN